MTEKKKELNKSDSKADLKSVPRMSQVCIRLLMINSPISYIITEFNNHNSTNISNFNSPS